MAELTELMYSVPEKAVLAIFYDSEGDIIQIDPMKNGYLIDAHDNRVQIDPNVKLKTRAGLDETKAQRISSQDTTPSTTVTQVHLNQGCLWVDHGGRNVWRCP
jgi:hypothetical protein